MAPYGAAGGAAYALRLAGLGLFRNRGLAEAVADAPTAGRLGDCPPEAGVRREFERLTSEALSSFWGLQRSGSSAEGERIYIEHRLEDSG